jgi:hypothetical protein
MTIKQKPGAGVGVGNYWPTVYAIKDKLREIQQRRESGVVTTVTASNAIHSERQTGKTTALVQFVAERTLILPYSDENLIAVLTPNLDIARRFEEQFIANFPTLRCPIVSDVGKSEDFEYSLQGHKIHEVYAEEMFLIPCRRIHEIADAFKFVAGVGTLQSIVSLNIKQW